MTHNHPPLIVYEKDKSLYYDCLRKYDEDEEIAPLEKFLEYETEKTWANQLELSEGLSQERKNLDDFEDSGPTLRM
jgi:hypothetical protein